MLRDVAKGGDVGTLDSEEVEERSSLVGAGDACGLNSSETSSNEDACDCCERMGISAVTLVAMLLLFFLLNVVLSGLLFYYHYYRGHTGRGLFPLAVFLAALAAVSLVAAIVVFVVLKSEVSLPHEDLELGAEDDAAETCDKCSTPLLEEEKTLIDVRGSKQHAAGRLRSEVTPVGDTVVISGNGVKSKAKVRFGRDVMEKAKESSQQPVAGCSKSEATGVPIGDTIVTPNTGARNKIRVKPKDVEERIPPITKRSLEQPIAGCSKSEATGVPIGDTNVTPDTGARNKIRVKPKDVEERIPPITKRSLEQPVAGCSKSEATGVPIGDTNVTPDTGARNKIRVKPKDVVVEKGEKKKGPGAAPIVTYRGCDTASCSGTSEYTYYGTTKGELSGMSYISLDLSEDTSLDSGLIELFTSTSSAALEKRRGGRFCVTVDATGLFCRVGEKILGLKCASGPALPDKEAPGELSTCSSRAPAQIFVLPQFPDEMEVFDDGKTVKVGGLDVKGGCIEFSYCVGVRKVTGIGLINIMLLNSDPENFVLLRRYMHLQHSRLYAFLKKKEEKLNRRAMLGNSDRKEYEKRIFAVLPAYLTGCEEGIDFAADLRRHCRGFEMVLARGLLEESSPSCRLLREALRRVRIHDSESTSKKRSDEGRGTDFSVMAGLYVISSSNGRFFGCSQKEKKGKKGKVAAKVVAEFFSNAGFRASLVATAFEMLGKAMLAGHVEDGSEEIASSIPWVCRQIPGLSEGIAFAVKASLDESFSDLYSAFANNTSLVSFLPMSIIPGFLNTRAGVSFSGDPEYVRRMRMHCALSEKLGDDFLLRFVIAGEALRRAKLWGGSELEFCERMITGSLTQVGSIRPLRGKLLDRLNALLPKLGLDELKELVVHALSYEILQFKSLGTEFLFEDLMYGISRDIPNYDALATNYVVTGGGSYSKGESILALLVSEDISGVYCFPLRESVIGMRVGDCTKREKKMDAIKSIDGGGRYCFGVG